MPTCLRAGDASRYSYTPTWALFSTAALWTGCAIFVQKRVDLFLVNACMVAITSVYLFFFFKLSKRDARRKLLVLIASSLSAVLLLFIVLFAPSPDLPHAGDVSKGLAVLVNLAIFVTPLQAISTAVRTLDTSRVPAALSVVSLLCATDWAIFGLVVEDYYVTMPNAFGATMSLIQLAALYYIRVRKGKAGTPAGGALTKTGTPASVADADDLRLAASVEQLTVDTTTITVAMGELTPPPTASPTLVNR